MKQDPSAYSDKEAIDKLVRSESNRSETKEADSVQSDQRQAKSRKTEVTQAASLRPSGRKKLTRGRLWSFRIIAILLGLSPLIGLEIGLRWAKLPKVTEALEPWIAFESVNPLFELDESQKEYRTAENRIDIFRADAFAATKPASEFRIFCLGGSTVQGRPYAIETSFTKWLELSLGASDPTRTWEVVNCGGVSYASYRLLPILDEVLGYEPDLIILYTGHNEFLEERTYSSYKQAGNWKKKANSIASNLRTYQLIRKWWLESNSKRNEDDTETDVLPEEVVARLDYERGLELFERDAKWTRTVEDHFEANLQQFILQCRKNEVPLLIVNPVENLRDCAPFKSVYSESLTEADRDKIESLHEQARSTQDQYSSVRLLEEAVQIDPQYALSHYWLGQARDRVGEHEAAKAAFLRAKEEDVCPLRMREAMHGSLLELCRTEMVPLLDCRQQFEATSRNGIVDQQWLLDHVHPTIEGHREIANWLMQAMESEGWIRRTTGWEERQQLAYKKHLETLDTAYYIHGQDRLKSLQDWTKGRAFNAFSREERRRVLDR